MRSNGNIVLVAILHGLYDFVLSSQSYALTAGATGSASWAQLTIAIWVIFSIILLVRRQKGLPGHPRRTPF